MPGALLAHRIGVLLHEYLLQFRTTEPPARRYYFTHWFRVSVTGDFALMRPMSAGDLRPREVSEPTIGVIEGEL